jgi:hypothetical protein
MPLKRLQAILGCNSLEMTQLYILEDVSQIDGSYSTFDQLIDVESICIYRRMRPRITSSVPQFTMNTLHIGVSSWIIQDGNYPDFRIGDVVRFALECHPHRILESSANSKLCTRLSASNYRVTAQTVFTTKNVFVLDFGFLAYDQAPSPKWMKAGQFVDADLYVGIDPFFYFEELHAIKGMPELRYGFRIRDIELETTPWISTVDSNGRTIMTRDESNQSFRQVAETDAWSDDNGNAHYVLDVERIENETEQCGEREPPMTRVLRS